MPPPHRLTPTNQALLSQIIARRDPETMSSPTTTTQSAATATPLPADFLVGPAQGIDPPKMIRLDFAKTELREYDRMYATIIDNVLSKPECIELVRLAEAQSDSMWERALINIGGGRQAMYEETRKCGRIIWDGQEVVDRLWERVKGLVPELEKMVGRPEVTGEGPSKRREAWRFTRLNERMRFLKYVEGEYFKREFFHLCGRGEMLTFV